MGVKCWGLYSHTRINNVINYNYNVNVGKELGNEILQCQCGLRAGDQDITVLAGEPVNQVYCLYMKMTFSLYERYPYALKC